jgi:hypothetical protein
MRQFVTYLLLTVLGLVLLSGCQAQKAIIRGPDGIVPMWCSERYLEAYGPHATLKVVEGENHTITRRRKQVVAETVEFFRGVFGR